MKKNYYYFIVFISLMLSSQLLSGQTIFSDPDFIDNGTTRSTTAYTCPTGDVFCYLPVNPTTGYSSDLSEGYQCYQSFSGATGPFSRVTVWILHLSTPSPGRELLVEVYNAGAAPGSLVSSTTALVDAVITGETILGHPVYTYTIDIPSASITEGWISVVATAGGSPEFYWANTFAVPSYPAMQNSDPLSMGLSLGLSGTQLPPIPLSNWAFALFVLLAATFIFIKFRK